MSTKILYCPSCATEKHDLDLFCNSCGFDFSAIRSDQNQTQNFQSTYYMFIGHKFFYKYRWAKITDNNYDKLFEFRQKFVSTGFKFTIHDFKDKLAGYLRSYLISNFCTFFSPFNKVIYSVKFNKSFKSFTVVDGNGNLVSEYICTPQLDGSFLLTSKLDSNNISFMRIDNSNPRKIKILIDQLSYSQHLVLFYGLYLLIELNETHIFSRPNSIKVS